MGRSSKGYLAVAAAAAAFAGVGSARAADPTTEQLMQQIQDLQNKVQRVNELEAKVQQLEARQDQQQTVSAQQVDATVERVLADAEKRSQLLQMEGFTAGYNKGRFSIQDAAGNWVLRPQIQFQFRFVENWREDGKQDGTSDDNNKGFEVRRMKFGFDGNAFTPNLTYNFLWATSSSSGSVSLEQAWVRYVLGDQWAIRAGQIVNPVFHEQTTSSRRQLAVDRSLVNQLITGTGEAFSQAVSVIYGPKDGALHVEIGAEDGFISGNTDFVDPNEGGSNNWGAFGRVNYFVSGPRAAWEDFTALGNKETSLVIGGGLDVTQTGDSNVYLHTVDVQWENAGNLGVYGAYYGNYTTSEDDVDDTLNWGFLVQAGYMLNPKWEIFGRYDYTKLDDDSVLASSGDEFCELTFGVNWFIFGNHGAKITADLTYLPNGSPSAVKGIGILEGEDAQWMFRGQFQLLL